MPFLVQKCSLPLSVKLQLYVAMPDVVIGALSAGVRNSEIYYLFHAFRHIASSWRTCRVAGPLKIGPRHK